MLGPRTPILQGLTLSSGQSSSVSFSKPMGRLDIQNLGSSKIYFSLTSTIGSSAQAGQCALASGGSWNKENIGYTVVSIYATGDDTEINLVSAQNSGDASD